MKTKLSFITLVICFTLCSFIPKSAEAKRYNVDKWVKDVNGGSHHIHGWFEISFFSLSHYDIWFDQIHMRAILDWVESDGHKVYTVTELAPTDFGPVDSPEEDIDIEPTATNEEFVDILKVASPMPIVASVGEDLKTLPVNLDVDNNIQLVLIEDQDF